MSHEDFKKGSGPKRRRKDKDPRNHDFWYPPYPGPWNQHVGSLCLCGLLGHKLEGHPSCCLIRQRRLQGKLPNICMPRGRSMQFQDPLRSFPGGAVKGTAFSGFRVEGCHASGLQRGQVNLKVFRIQVEGLVSQDGG